MAGVQHRGPNIKQLASGRGARSRVSPILATACQVEVPPTLVRFGRGCSLKARRGGRSELWATRLGTPKSRLTLVSPLRRPSALSHSPCGDPREFGTFREQALGTVPLEATQRPEVGEMIPTHMLHQLERTRTRAERREADIRTSDPPRRSHGWVVGSQDRSAPCTASPSTASAGWRLRGPCRRPATTGSPRRPAWRLLTRVGSHLPAGGRSTGSSPDHSRQA